MVEALRGVVDFIGPLALLILAAVLFERWKPWRTLSFDGLRYIHVGMLYIFAALLAWIILPAGHVGVAILSADAGFGLLHVIDPPLWISIAVSFVLLDLVQWLVHLALHKIPALWRLHRLHHSDDKLDAATALRFHPLETVLRFFAVALVIVLSGAPVVAVLISYAATMLFDVWEHANIPLPKWIAPASKAIITPDVHRLHHSADPRHRNCNLGTIFTLWDRLAGTWAADAVTSETKFGLSPQPKVDDTLGNLLLDPLRRDDAWWIRQESSRLSPTAERSEGIGG